HEGSASRGAADTARGRESPLIVCAPRTEFLAPIAALLPSPQRGEGRRRAQPQCVATGRRAPHNTLGALRPPRPPPQERTATMANSFGSQAKLTIDDQDYTFYSLAAVAKTFPEVLHLPYALRILLENLLRTEDGQVVRAEHIAALARWQPKAEPSQEIAFTPSRVLLQDFTGVPAVVDLAAMRDAVKRLGGDPKRINPLQDVELVVDHSVQVDVFA